MPGTRESKMEGVRRRVEAGLWGCGRPPYGYQSEGGGVLVLDPYRATMVRKVFDMYDAGVGKTAIATALNYSGAWHSDGKGQWGWHQVDNILRMRPFYEGKMGWFDGALCRVSNPKQPRIL